MAQIQRLLVDGNLDKLDPSGAKIKAESDDSLRYRVDLPDVFFQTSVLLGEGKFFHPNRGEAPGGCPAGTTVGPVGVTRPRGQGGPNGSEDGTEIISCPCKITTMEHHQKLETKRRTERFGRLVTLDTLSEMGFQSVQVKSHDAQ